MSLEVQIIALAQAIGGDIKALNVKTGDLGALTTTAKNNIVSAINELKILAEEAARMPDIDANKTTTGVFNIARIPDIPLSKMDAGVATKNDIIPVNKGGTGATTAAAGLIALGGNNAANLTAGVIPVARLPNIDAAKTTTGVFNIARIPDIPVSKVTGAALSTDIIPLTRGGTGSTTVLAARTALGTNDAANLTTGVLNIARIPTIPTSKISPAVATQTDLSDAINSLLSTDPSHIESNITVTVGAGGDYATINEALTYLSKFTPVYYDLGITATIRLLAGFVMAEQVLVRGLNLGWVTIVGVDTETIITHTALTIDFSLADYGFRSVPAFGVSNGGMLPRIGQLFRFNVAKVLGEKHGVMAIGAGSSADILRGCGVKNAGTYGIVATRGSTVSAYGADASGAGTYGIFATRGSTISADMIDASGAGTYGIFANLGSTVSAYGADASGAGTYGIYATQGSTVCAQSSTGTLSQATNTVTSNGIIFK